MRSNIRSGSRYRKIYQKRKFDYALQPTREIIAEGCGISGSTPKKKKLLNMKRTRRIL